MILDNLTRAFRTQNWLTVATEFVIVIAGVVIGFQINAWNEARADRALAERYVADVRADITADLSMYQSVRRMSALRREAGLAVLDAIETGPYGDPGVAYYRAADTQESGFDLQRRRVFDDYLPHAVAALPLETQRWVYEQLRDPLEPAGDGAPPAAVADAALTRLRDDASAVTALKAVVRGSWSLDLEIDRMERDARAVLAALEAEE
ncbi:MAG: hypothetical protein ABL308_05295 [Oceanicaulis sp.]